MKVRVHEDRVAAMTHDVQAVPVLMVEAELSAAGTCEVPAGECMS